MIEPREKDNKGNNKKIRYRQLDILEKLLSLKFKDRGLLNRSLVHRSYVNESFEKKPVSDNERLEYLGDSVLALVVNEYLFKAYPEYPEGQLAKIKSAVVSEPTLAKAARIIDLGNYLLMGKGEEGTGGKDRSSILANSFEALIGAIYLDQGLKASRKFILSQLKKDIERIDSLTYLRDPKTTLQEYVQKAYKTRPEYHVRNEAGPDHEKHFTVELQINNRTVSTGNGTSKRKAEKDAAINALKMIENGELAV